MYVPSSAVSHPPCQARRAHPGRPGRQARPAFSLGLSGRLLGVLLLVLAAWPGSAPAAPPPSPGRGAIQWQTWSNDLFVRAQRENRLVLLDLEAVWCHWCHVMDETTYRDPQVVRLIGQRYIAVKVDQDSHPELSNRYEDYGWPATIVFAPDGRELARRRGYIPPPGMSAMLQAFADDPSPGPSVTPEEETPAAAQGALTAEQRQKLTQGFVEAYDDKYGGWGSLHKFIALDQIEWSLVQARGGDARHERMTRQTLDAALGLIDPVWGGVSQYSDSIDWKSPHYEKIMSSQTQTLRSYALAYMQFGEARYGDAARRIARYLTEFLRSPEGAFYTSQDADLGRGIDGHRYYDLDDAGRRKLGMPRIDRNHYPRENGWAIAALVELYAATGDRPLLDAARRATAWIEAHRGAPKEGGGGGFRHGEGDRLFLGDTLAMAQAYLATYAATGDRTQLAHAEEAARFIAAHFRDKDAGFDTAPPAAGAAGARGPLARPVRQLDENIDLARFANRLHHYTGKDEYHQLAEHAMRYLASPGITGSRPLLPGILLADRELSQPPVHITVVGQERRPQGHGAICRGAALSRQLQAHRVVGPAGGPAATRRRALSRPRQTSCLCM